MQDDSQASLTALPGAGSPAPASTSVEKLAKSLITKGKYSRARRLLETELPTKSVPILLLLSDACLEMDDYGKAGRLAFEAFNLEKTIGTVRRYLRILYICENYIVALGIYRSLPQQLRKHPKVQWEMHLIYEKMGWWRKAAKASRRAHRAPSGPRERFTETLFALQPWRSRREEDYRKLLLDWSVGLRKHIARSDFHVDDRWLYCCAKYDLYVRQWARLYKSNEVLLFLFRLFLWFALLTSPALLAYVLDDSSAHLFAAFSGVASAAFYVLGSKLSKVLHPGWKTAIISNLLVLLAVATVARRQESHNLIWWFATAVGSAVVGAITGGISVYSMAWVYRFRLSRLRRRSPEAAALDYLLDFRVGLERPGYRDDSSWRHYWLGRLEEVSRLVERHFCRQLPEMNEKNAKWLSDRTAGASANIHQIQRMLLSGSEKSHSSATRLVSRHINALVSNNWAELPYTTPEVVERTKRSERIATYAKVLIAGALPAVTTFSFAFFTNDKENIALDWARVGSVVWALAYIVLAIDPNAKSNFQTVREITASIRADDTRSSSRATANDSQKGSTG